MAKKMKIDESDIISCLTAYRAEAGMARRSRIEQNRVNFDCYNLNQDWSYKRAGQSTEFLPKTAMAVEQAANFLQQGLLDPGEWFKTESSPGLIPDMMKIKPEEIRRLTSRQVDKNDIYTFAGNCFKSGLVGSLMIAKVGGKQVPKPKYVAETKLKNGKFKTVLVKKEDKVWQLELSLVRQENFYPDPTGNGLYVMEDIFIDYYELLQKAEAGFYDVEKVRELRGQYSSEGADKQWSKARETGQNVTNPGYRNRIKLTEIWGNLLNGEGELIAENVVTTIANDRIVIQPPTPNPNWYCEHPYVITPILTVPNGVWGKALMDAPTMLNRACNEMFNLMLDGGMMAVHGIKQIRENWLEDPSQVDEGVAAGDTLRVNNQCPPGQSVLERVDTSSIPQEGFNMFNLLNQELYTASMTNDLRMGVASFRQVKATEVVEASQSITSMFNGMAKQIEEKFMTPLLAKSWMTICQNMNDLDSNEVRALLGETRADALLSMGNEELFASTVEGIKFEVFGISAILNKQKDFTKLQAMLQTIASSPVLMEEFAKEYDFNKLLTEIMKSLDLNPSKLKPDVDQAMQAGAQAPPMQAEQGLPQAQSQIPQAGAAVNQGGESLIPSTEFPASRATPSVA